MPSQETHAATDARSTGLPSFDEAAMDAAQPARESMWIDPGPALMQHCSLQTRLAILNAARIERLANRRQVHSAGQPMENLSLILDGILEVSSTSVTGKRHVNAYLPRGRVFGLIPLIDRKGCTHDTWARGGPLTLMSIPADTIRRCMAQDRRFQEAVMQDLCESSRQMFTTMQRHALLTLRARTAWTLCNLVEQHGFSRSNRRKLNIRLSQDGLSDMLGVTRQSTNRELKQLEREGTIALGVSEIEVLDLDALHRASESWL